MKKSFISLFLILSLLVSLAPSALGAMSLSNFNKIRDYRDSFSDVLISDWYYTGVRSAYESGIIEGRGGGIYDPGGTLSLAEALKIAAVLHKGYHTGTFGFETGTPWYAPYADYLRAAGIPVSPYKNLEAPATRSDFALIISNAFPDEALTPVNRIADGTIPDVFESYSYGQAVYKLYRAGILRGSDDKGTFYPGRTLTRAEAAVIIMRIVDADTREIFNMDPVLTGEQIYKNASPAVFFVEVFDEEGVRLKTGSGFFISKTGIAVTNYHVIIGAHSARITMDDGEVLDVAGIYDYNRKRDAAIIHIEGEDFPYLEMADSTVLQTGATVYALGSPLGLQASFSRGIVSQSLREIDGVEFIQLDAAISSGSSGGALLDSFGRVVGVTSATMLNSQNINLAVPMDIFSNLDHESYIPLEDALIPVTYYESFYPAPDFGAFFDAEPVDTNISQTRTTYSYSADSLPGDIDEIIDEYAHLLEQNHFEHTSNITGGDISLKVYSNARHSVTVALGKSIVNGEDRVIVRLY